MEGENSKTRKQPAEGAHVVNHPHHVMRSSSVPSVHFQSKGRVDVVFMVVFCHLAGLPLTPLLFSSSSSRCICLKNSILLFFPLLFSTYITVLLNVKKSARELFLCSTFHTSPRHCDKGNLVILEPTWSLIFRT